MNPAGDTDVLILGAGPAGLAAALRLRQLGYRVAVCDRSALPRPQIGESLTPGLNNLLDFLGMADLLATVPQCVGLATRRRWSHADREDAGMTGGVSHRIVDRGRFDHALLERVRAAGGLCLLPTRVRGIDGEAGAWRVRIETAGRIQVLGARFVLDARGRRSVARETTPTAPALLSLWAEYDGDDVEAIRIEALPQCWLWGARLPDGASRVMAFCDPATPRREAGGDPEAWLRAMLRQSHLFAQVANARWCTRVQGCAATPYVAHEVWSDGQAKLGDAAFALDPLSSSGVERAMRFSLQAVTAIHTALSSTADAVLARDYFHDSLVQAVARHLRWTRDCYAQAWPATAHPFWQVRATDFALPDATTPILCCLREVLAAQRLRSLAPPHLPTNHVAHDDPSAVLQAHVSLCPRTRFVTQPCVVDDRVQRRLAIDHPNLERPLAWLDGIDVVPLFDAIATVANLAQLIEQWSTRMQLRSATRLVGWLLHKGVVVVELMSESGSGAEARQSPSDPTAGSDAGKKGQGAISIGRAPYDLLSQQDHPANDR